MKYADFYTGSNKITFYNSHLGIETVPINGKQASKKFSINGALHKFSVDDKEFYLASEYTLFNNNNNHNKIRLELYEGKKLIESKVIAVHAKQRIIWIATSIILVYYCFKYFFS